MKRFNSHDRVLIDMPHGLGDCVQVSIVLQHLKDAYPDLLIDVQCAHGKKSSFVGHCRNVFYDHEPNQNVYDHRVHLDWWEADVVFDDAPSTKATKCLHEAFGIKASIKPYVLTITDKDRERAAAYIERLPERPFVLLHYQGNTSQNMKNLNHSTIKKVVRHLQEHGYTPVILDWDNRSPIPDQQTVFCPNKDDALWGNTGTGDAAILGALIERAALFIGVDSGPLHVAESTKTPSIGCWVRHHPIHFSDVSGNVIHLVPNFHESLIRGNAKKGLAFFEQHYQYRTYHMIDNPLIALINERLGIVAETTPEITIEPYIDKDHYYDDHRAKGTDFLFYGSWQKEYGAWFVDSLGLSGKTILDVGCGCGAIAFGLQEAGATVHAIDINTKMVMLGRDRFHLASLNVCDALNLHHFHNDSIDCIHLSHVMGEFRADHAEAIVKEFHRVLRKGGLVLSVDGRSHQWETEFLACGFRNVSEQHVGALVQHRLSKAAEYHWKFDAWRKG